jgi:hypothetical protein
MSPLVLALLAFVSVGALGIAFVPAIFGFGSERADKRRKALRDHRVVARSFAPLLMSLQQFGAKREQSSR